MRPLLAAGLAIALAGCSSDPGAADPAPGPGADGGATNGKGRILDIMPTELHQRTPLIIGSKDDVAAFRQFTAAER